MHQPESLNVEVHGFYLRTLKQSQERRTEKFLSTPSLNPLRDGRSAVVDVLSLSAKGKREELKYHKPMVEIQSSCPE